DDAGPQGDAGDHREARREAGREERPVTTPHSQPGFDHGIDSPAAAVEAICARIAVVEAEEVDLDDAFGRALAAPIIADRPSPAADVSAMDGYALGTPTVPGGRNASSPQRLQHTPQESSDEGDAGAAPGSVPPGRGGYPVAFEIHIGQDPGELPEGGACARIVTGAAVPR